jgi:hypothetical protein
MIELINTSVMSGGAHVWWPDPPFLRHQPRIGAGLCQQLVMGVALDDLAFFEQDDLVAIADRTQAMRNDDAGAAPTPKIVVDLLFRIGIERGRRFMRACRRGLPAPRND